MRHTRAMVVVSDHVHDPQSGRDYAPGDRIPVPVAQRMGLRVDHTTVVYEEPRNRG